MSSSGQNPRLPNWIKPYRDGLQALSVRTKTPLPALAFSFAILHELTAIVPGVALWYGAHKLNLGPQLLARVRQQAEETSSSATEESYLQKSWREGEELSVRLSTRYGLFGVEKGKKLSEDEQADLLKRIGGDIANIAFAYVAVKVGLPLRIGTSMYFAPAFSRRFLNPIGSRFGQLFRRKSP